MVKGPSLTISRPSLTNAFFDVEPHRFRGAREPRPQQGARQPVPRSAWDHPGFAALSHIGVGVNWEVSRIGACDSSALTQGRIIFSLDVRIRSWAILRAILDVCCSHLRAWHQPAHNPVPIEPRTSPSTLTLARLTALNPHFLASFSFLSLSTNRRAG